jgi:hypothetical protein
MEDTLDSLSWLYTRINEHINSAGKNEDFNLDFLEGFVYALLLVQEDVKGLRLATKKEES